MNTKLLVGAAFSLPLATHAQNGVATGATTGAVTGAIVRGPIGAAVGVGAVAGGIAASAAMSRSAMFHPTAMITTFASARTCRRPASPIARCRANTA